MISLFAFLMMLAASSAYAADPAALSQIGPIVREEIAAGRLPGAVVWIGGKNGILYHHAFGEKAMEPGQAMTEDTLFDLASVTKTVATTTAVMQLVEAGKLDLEAPAARYWPEFAANGKGGITLHQLLTHYSGLRADLNLEHAWSGHEAALRLMLEEKPAFPPGTHYLYSDINFEILGELVEKVSGMPLDRYCRMHIFDPLGMSDTGFKPVFSRRIAPTGWKRRGEVNDPTAFRMGGVSGHAGLFSTAGDLAKFAGMMLNGGQLGKVRILKPSTIERMTVPQSPEGRSRLRGLGWDIDAPFASNRDTLLPAGAYGHTGFTGTSIWIDPVSKIFVILLTNRVYPDGRGNVKPLRNRLVSVMDEAVGKVSETDVAEARPALAAYLAAQKVESGLDVIEEQGFSPLKGMRIGLITNQTGRDRKGRSCADLLRMVPGVRLLALFSPEHGLHGEQDGKVVSGSDPSTGLPVYSLYGKVKKPTRAMLENIDALVFDIQDAGVRFYTYTTTMAYAMEAAAGKGIPFYVLDRPDPITADAVQGPMLDPGYSSFTGYFPLPVRYGMTLGELARFFNAEAGIGADLRVIPMRGYRRLDWYDTTGQPWIPPSPNLRSLAEATLYPGIALLEGANVSVGRGTGTPFEVVGAPWIEASTLAQYLSARNLAGVRFAPLTFTPESDRYKGQACHGVRITVSGRDSLDSPELGVEIAAALFRLYPEHFRLDDTFGAIGSHAVIEAIRNGKDPRTIASDWQPRLEAFRKRRAHYLIYSDMQ